MSESYSSKSKQIDQTNVEAFLFQIEGSDFKNFDQLELYLQKCDKSIQNKIGELQSKLELQKDQLIRTAGVYQLNNKKRVKEEQLLQIQRERIKKNLQIHKTRLNIPMHPITLVLREKHNQIARLNQTKQIIEDFNKIVNGNQEEMIRTLPLDQKNFNNSALKIYVFKCILQQMTNPGFDKARIFIRRRFIDLKNKIISNFKEGYIKKDIIIVNNILPFCEQYELLDQISDFYNNEAFKQSHKLGKIQQQMIESEIKNLFFLLKRGLHYAFSDFIGGNEKNSYKISTILSKHSQFISRRLITYAFQVLIKQSIQNVLKNFQNSSGYLLALQNFCVECKELLKYCEQIITQQKISHLIVTYIDSIFDNYLDSYLYKQIIYLNGIYEDCIASIVEQIKAIDALQDEQVSKKDVKKFSFKKLMDYKIETKKVYNVQYVRQKLQALSNIFMDPALQKLFEATKYALNRNNKISKINNVDRNRNQILSVFIKQVGELVNTIITSMRDVLPGFNQSSPPLQHEFFQVVPQINVVLQRMEFIYSQFKKQALYELSESIKLEQKKEDLITVCQKNLNSLVADALACILSSQKSILKQRTTYSQGQQEGVASKLFIMLQKYIKAINRISQINYRQTLLKTLGLQFVNLLIIHYSKITYNKDGLGAIYVDVGGFGKILKMINNAAVEERYKVFKSLIDIYVLKNEQKQINSYIKTEREGILKNEKDQTIRSYIKNKQTNQKPIQ